LSRRFHLGPTIDLETDLALGEECYADAAAGGWWIEKRVTRPATEGDPSAVASDADIFNVEPSPVAPTHTGASQAVGGDRKTVDPLHSSGRCKCAAFSMRRMQELGEIIGFQEAIAKVREVVTDSTSRQQIDSVVAREFPALFEKLSREVE
jgi:hypothetical protein